MATTSRDRRPGTRSRGRGAAAAFGFILLFAGLIGGGVLFVLSTQRHDKAIEKFARAGVGCTTSLEFSKSGTFYVYAETAGDFDPQEIGCEPQATPNQAFFVEFNGPAPVSPRGTRPSRTTPTTSPERPWPGSRSPSRERMSWRFAATAPTRGRRSAATRRTTSTRCGAARSSSPPSASCWAACCWLLAGWRSKRASTPSIPEGPGWDLRPGEMRVRAWPPEPPRIPQVPINPHQPDIPAVGGTAPAAAAGAGTWKRGADTIAVGTTATWDGSGGHDAARTGGASASA